MILFAALSRFCPIAAMASWGVGLSVRYVGRQGYLVEGPQAQSPCGTVIPPFLMGLSRRIHAAVFSFVAGVMPPMPMLGRSVL